MNPERWRKIEDIYNSALSLRPEERDAFVRAACAGDESIRKEVASLIGWEPQAERFIEAPAIQMAAEEFIDENGDADSCVGRALLHYSVIEQIGHGGMGIVYRAQDTRLDRAVAIKMLPPAFAADPERLARFNREARILASLNDSHIAAIHGLEQADGRPFVVLELVEGVTLADRLREGPLPVSETLDICGQIAEGLQAAHDRGVIHRDLKPANVKITPERKLKILDFGLAKALADEAAPSDLMHSPTITKAMTQPGVLLGTAAYMSPEQATGKTADKRADVWAFGCLLYECLTGRRAFAGETGSETIASILRDEPDWGALPKGTPETVRTLLRACLQKDPAQRPASVADAWNTLEKSAPPTNSIRRGWKRTVAIVSMAALAAVASAVLLFKDRFSRVAESPMRAVPLTTYPGIESQPAFSPDGRDVAFAWQKDGSGTFDIYRQTIGSGEPLRLTPGSGNHFSPAWSPDGKFIAFLADGPRESSSASFVGGGGRRRVCRVPALGGTEQVLADLEPWGFSILRPAPNIGWTPDGQWLIVRNRSGPDGRPGLFLLSVEGGQMRRLTTGADFDPSVSPDGRAVAFVRYSKFTVGDVHIQRLTREFQPEGEPERLTFENRDVFSPVWTEDGQVVFSSGPWFSERRLLQVPARAVSRAEEYRPEPLGFGENAGTLALSTAGRRLVYTRESWNSNLYRVELTGGSAANPQRFLPSTWCTHTPDYSPDGTRIAFSSTRWGSEEIWVCNADGTDARPLTSMGGAMTAVPRWSPDGASIVFHSMKEGSHDLYIVHPDSGRVQRLTNDPKIENQPSWSRDGKWIFFGSDRSGRHEIYRMPASGGTATQLTRNAGRTPIQSVDGRWVFYRKGDALWKVPTDGGEEIQVLKPIGYELNYAVTAGGIYFLDASPNVTLRFFDFATGKNTPLLETGARPSLWPIGMTVSPDCRYVLFPLWDRFDSDLMLMENFR